MIYSIDEFQQRLDQEFGRRLRIRESKRDGLLHVEQKVGRIRSVAFPVPLDNDELIRARDGYMGFLRISKGDRMKCPRQGCMETLKVPIGQFGHMVCDWCRMRGYEYRYEAGFFELGDRLIEYLRMCDPLRGASEQLRDRVDKWNAKLIAQQERQVNNVLEAGLKDRFTEVTGIKSVGWTKRDMRNTGSN